MLEDSLRKAFFTMLVLAAMPGPALSANLPKQDADQPRLVWGEGCSFACNDHPDCKPPEISFRQEHCDYIANKKISPARFNKKASDEQKTLLEAAESVLKEYTARKRTLLQKTVGGGVDAATPEHLRTLKRDVRKEKERAAAVFGTNSVFLQELATAERDLEPRIGAATAAAAKKNMDAKLAEAPDNKTLIGQSSRTKEQLTKAGSVNKKGAVLNQKFDNAAPEAGRSGGPTGTGPLKDAPKLRGASAMGGATRGSYTSYNRDRIPEMAIPTGPSSNYDVSRGPVAAPAGKGGEAAAKAVAEQEAPKKPKDDNAWVKAVKKEQVKIEDHGTEMLVQADRHSTLGDKTKAQQDAKASEEWKQGNYGSAAWEKMKGWGSKAYHTGAQVAYTGRAVNDAVTQGMLDVARGDEVAVKKVAVGGAAIAVIATGGAALAAAPVLTGGALGGAAITAGGAGLTTYGVASGSGQMLRAQDKKEFALGFAEAGLSAAGGTIAKGVGGLVTKAAPEAMAAGGSLVARGATTGLTRLAAAAEAKALTNLSGKALSAAAQFSDEAAQVVVKKVVGKTGEIVIEKGVKAGAEYALSDEK